MIKKIIFWFIVFGFVVSVVSNFWLFYKNRELQSARNGNTSSSDIVTKVSRLMELPKGEIPTVATVTNPEKLKNQTFFAKSSVGDKVLIYKISGKAILYSPTLNKILEATTTVAN